MSSCFMLSCFMASCARSDGWSRNAPASAVNAKPVLIVRIIRISPLRLVFGGRFSGPLIPFAPYESAVGQRLRSPAQIGHTLPHRLLFEVHPPLVPRPPAHRAGIMKLRRVSHA